MFVGVFVAAGGVGATVDGGVVDCELLFMKIVFALSSYVEV